MGSVILALALVGLLGLVAAAFFWQGHRRRPGEAVVYGMEQVVEYVWARLPESRRALLSRHDIRRVLEAQMHLLHLRMAQDPAGTPIVIGGPELTDLVREQTARQDHDYSTEAIREIIDLQTGYLASIGAVADPVSAEEVRRLSGGADSRSVPPDYR